MLQDLDHKHLFVYATVKSPPTDPDKMKDWFCRMVEAVGMKVVIPPQVVNLKTPGNEGITGVVTIETSHSSIHVWESAEVAFLQFDLYSCKAFDPMIVLRLISEFDPYFYEFMLVDRNDDFKVIEQRTEQVVKVVDLLSPDSQRLYLEGKKTKDKSTLTSAHRKANADYNKLARKYSARSSSYSSRRLASHSSTLATIKQRSKKLGLEFDLDAEWYDAELVKAQNRYPKLVAHGPTETFWGANVDRVDPLRGYTKDNCRIIPRALNVAKWKWSPEELAELKVLIKDL